MSWVRGDRIRVTLEVIAEEPSDETGDVWFRNSFGRTWLNLPDIQEAGGTASVEVISEIKGVLFEPAVPCSRPLASQLRAECSQSVEGCPAAIRECHEAKAQFLAELGNTSCLSAKYEKLPQLLPIVQLNVSGKTLDSPSVVVSVLVTPDSSSATVGVPAGLPGSPSGESAGLTPCEGCSHECS